jgi:glutathione S-transferase
VLLAASVCVAADSVQSLQNQNGASEHTDAHDRAAMQQLVIANKNYSSWSLRPWLLLKVKNIPFAETKLRLDVASPASTFRSAMKAQAPKASGKVPLLIEPDGLQVHDSLAICERLAELHPKLGLWPASPSERALARAVVCEMHSGFTDMRQNLVVNLEAHLPVQGRAAMQKPGVAKDVARVFDIWQDLLSKHQGPFLFGEEFTIADAFFAPVVTRFVTYEIAAPSKAVAAYMHCVMTLPAMLEWIHAAKQEHDFIPEQEPHRESPAAKL